MINQSLDLFKMEQGIYQFQPISVNIISVINQITAETRHGSISMATSEENGTTITIHLPKANQINSSLIPLTQPGNQRGHDDQTNGSLLPQSKVKNVLMPGAFAEVSPEIVSKLSQALIEGDYHTLKLIIAEIRLQNSALADSLLMLAEKFAFDEILDLL